MANISGTNLAAGIAPFTTDDIYPTHYSRYGHGGWHEVATLADLDLIPLPRRTEGMAVRVTALEETYIYTKKDDGSFYWKEMQTGTPIVIQTGDAVIQPNVLNVWQTAVTSLTITKGTDIDGELNHYFVRFKAGANTTVTFEGFALQWYAVDAPTWINGKTYEVSIINNLALWAEF